MVPRGDRSLVKRLEVKPTTDFLDRWGLQWGWGAAFYVPGAPSPVPAH